MSESTRDSARTTGPAIDAHYRFILWLTRTPRSRNRLSPEASGCACRRPGTVMVKRVLRLSYLQIQGQVQDMDGQNAIIA